MKSTQLSGYNFIQEDLDNELHQNNEKISLTKENNKLKYELRVWEHAYYEIIKIFGNIVPISEEIAKNSIDKQNTLVKLCRDVVKSIDDPDNLLQKLQMQNEQNNKKKAKKKKNINTNVFLKNKPYIEQLVSSKLTNRLHDIDIVLSKEIEKNKKYIPKHISNNQPKMPRKTSIPNQKNENNMFPPYSELISSSFHEKTKKDNFQVAPNNFDFKKKMNDDRIENRNPQNNLPRAATVRKNKKKTNNYQCNKIKRLKR